MDEQVLIVGAGPTGLVLALWLAKCGILLRIIDKDSGPGRTSRAIAVHARILEFYQQIGIAEEVIANGIVINHIAIRKNGKIKATVNLGLMGKGYSPFPFVLSFPQDDHEKLLIEHLQRLGIHVERNTELISYTQNQNKVEVILKKNNSTESISTPYLFGCDGGHSTVRELSGIEFLGGTYSQLYYVADVMAIGDVANADLQLCLSKNEFSLVFPVRSSGSVRLIGIVPEKYADKKQIQFSDVAPTAIQNTNLSISNVHWFSTYHSHHRVANHFRKERIFLLGDAAHIHSPVGGQGMNTGIGDAINLAWKIAAVLQNRISVSVLETFEKERMAFARRLTATTDQLFRAIINKGLIGKFIRNIFMPYIIPFLIRFQSVKHFFFKTVSQIKINYRHSFLSEGIAGRVSGGDRLPWIQTVEGDNFKSLTLLDWQIHVYGKTKEDFKNALTSFGLTLNEYAWSHSAYKAGLQENAFYLIRPDGYVGYASSTQNSEMLGKYLLKYKIKTRKQNY